jgi:hypothetical protein
METETTDTLKHIDVATVAPPTSDDWTNLGGQFRGTPAGVFYGNALFAFVRGTDSGLKMCKVSSKSWSPLGGALVSDPAVAPSPNGALGVIALLQGNVVGVNYVQPFQGTQTGFSVIGGGSPTDFDGTPVLAVNLNQRLEAFILDKKGTMWHTFQKAAGATITWQNWSPLGSTFLRGATFTVFLNTNTGRLHAVALGTDNLMYQMIQYAGGGRDDWSAPALVGQASTDTIQIVNGTAAAHNTGTSRPVHAGYNSKSRGGDNPLIYCSPPVPPTWTNLTFQGDPTPNNVPVMVSNAGVPQLAYLTTSNQAMLLVQATTEDPFWKDPQTVGKDDPQFTGRMSAVANSSNLALFQGYADGTLRFINYLPV